MTISFHEIFASVSEEMLI